MTLDEAIKHCEEEAEKYMEYGIETECYQCGKEHEQLAEWLKELKELRDSVGAIKLKAMKEALELIRALKASLQVWEENPFKAIGQTCIEKEDCTECQWDNICPQSRHYFTSNPEDWINEG